MQTTTNTEKTQKEIVLEKLLKDGEVSNFWAIQHYILRLGAIICDLKKDGYYFRGDYLEGTKNWTYYLLRTNEIKL